MNAVSIPAIAIGQHGGLASMTPKIQATTKNKLTDYDHSV
jgi:hypothetical protein